MAMPAYNAPHHYTVGAQDAGASSCSPGLPPGIEEGLWMAMLVNSGGASSDVGVTAGVDETWELAPDMPLTLSLGSGLAHRMRVYLCRVTAALAASPTSPTVARGTDGDYIVAAIVALSGAYSFGDAVEAVDAYASDVNSSTSTNTLTFLDAPSSVPRTAYLFFATTGDDVATASHGAITNASVTFLTERIDGGTTTGGGGTIYIANGVKFYTGAFAAGAPTCTPGVGGKNYIRYALAIKPPQLDTAAPVVDNVSPADESTIAATDTISFRVTDAFGDGFGEISIFARSATGKGEHVYLAESFNALLYTESTVTPVSNGFEFTLKRVGGWYDSAVTILIVATDKAGNRATEALTYTVTGYEYNPDETPPTFEVVSPAEDSTITPNQALTVDVKEETALRVSVLTVSFPGGTEEVVHDGANFCGLYSSSSRSSIEGGHRYVITRRGGWPGSPTVRHYIVDTSGNKAA